MSDLILASVYSPTETINGYTQDKLGDEWWKTVYKIPAEVHFGTTQDQEDSRGRRGSAEKALEAQFGESVLFIGGAFAIEPNILPEDPDPVPTVVVERTIVLPNNGRATVFLPLLNGVWNNLTNDPASNYTVEELKDQADFVFNPDTGLVSELFGFVDDKPVPDLFEHRQASAEAFDYNTPYPLDNSLLGKLGYNDESIVDNRDNLSSDDPPPIPIKDLAMGNKVTIGPSIADGYWAAVDVKGGSHTLHFGGTINQC